MDILEKILIELQNPINWYLWSGVIIPLALFLHWKKKQLRKPVLEAFLLGLAIAFFSFIGGYAALLFFLPQIGVYAYFLFKKNLSMAIKSVCLIVTLITSMVGYFLIWKSFGFFM